MSKVKSGGNTLSWVSFEPKPRTKLPLASLNYQQPVEELTRSTYNWRLANIPVKYMFMDIAHIHIISDNLKVKKASCMQNTHLFGIRVSKHSQRNYCPIPFFYLVAIEAYYALSHHPTVSYINNSIITF